MAAVTSVGRASEFDPLEPPDDSRLAARLYERHSSRVLGYCLSRLGRREDAEDAVQTTFLQAVRSLRRGVVPLIESAWLIGIARNVCRARWEAAGRERRLESVCDPVDLDEGNAAPESYREELIGLEHALAQLPEQQRNAVLLRDWRGLSYEEVATQLGVSHAAVETLIFRGRRRLAELLGEEPSATRRRLGSLGNLGSLVTALKSAFGGAATATKIAAAVGVTALAVGGTAVAIDEVAPSPGTTPAPGASRSPASQGRPAALQAPAPTPARSRSAPAPAAAAVVPRPAPAGSTPAGPTVPSAADAPAPAEPLASPADTPPPDSPARPTLEASTTVTPDPPATVAIEPAPSLTAPIESVGGAVTDTVTGIAEPLTTSVTELVADTVTALPPVSVTPPPPVPVPPVTLP